ncbi:MAG: hypothetical protein NUV53_02570 [Patescibacteria group bacterium]|nr:hypothetical protein [Patescibacteria group bacterium]
MNSDEFMEKLREFHPRHSIEWRDRLTCGASSGIKVRQFPPSIFVGEKIVIAVVEFDNAIQRVEVHSVSAELSDGDIKRVFELLLKAGEVEESDLAGVCALQPA